MTLQGFYNAVSGLSSQKPDQELKPFLLSLYGLLPRYVDKPASLELIYKLILEALETEPVKFNEDWLEISEPPTDTGLVRKFTHPDVRDIFDRTVESLDDPVEFTLETMKFQLSELHKMEGRQLDDPMRYFGVTSATGQTWYNFTAFSVLECGLACMLDNGDNAETIDWSFLGQVLEDGRVYE